MQDSRGCKHKLQPPRSLHCPFPAGAYGQHPIPIPIRFGNKEIAQSTALEERKAQEVPKRPFPMRCCEKFGP